MLVHVHTAALDPSEIVVIGGVPVTSLARTVADLARMLPFEQAVVIADSAMFHRRPDRVTPPDLVAALDRSPTAEDPRVEAKVVAAMAKQVDGVVLCSPRMQPAQLERLVGTTPLVLVNRDEAGCPPCSCTPPTGRASRARPRPRGALVEQAVSAHPVRRTRTCQP